MLHGFNGLERLEIEKCKSWYENGLSG